jgi:hypothetical protein
MVERMDRACFRNACDARTILQELAQASKEMS